MDDRASIVGRATACEIAISGNFTGTMRKIFLFFAALFFSVILYSQKKSFTARIEQGNNAYAVSPGSEISLRREPFKIVITLKDIEGVYLFADFADSIFKLNEKEEVPGFKYLPEMAMAEPRFNEDKELAINKTGWSYWFYEKDMDWHRFDKDVLVTPDSVVATKTIKQFYFVDTKDVTDIGKIDQSLYLFFLAVEETKKGGIPKKELMRRKIRINWE